MGGRGSSSGTSRTAVTPESRAVLDLVNTGQISIERDQGDLYVSRYNPIPRQDAERPVIVSIHRNTYENRETIKAAGFKWDPHNRVWVYNSDPKGSPAIRFLQRACGADPDGIMGPGSINALIRCLGNGIQDGVLDAPSKAIMGLQRWLNGKMGY